MVLMTMIARITDGLPLACSVQGDDESVRFPVPSLYLVHYFNLTNGVFIFAL